MVTCISELTERIENKFENLNDRQTAISNQTKHEQQSSTDALAVINEELSSLKSELQSKIGTILPKIQSIFDEVKIPSNLASVKHNQKKNDKSKNDTQNQSICNSQSQHASAINDNAMELNIPESTIPTPSHVIDHTSQHTKSNEPKRDHTLILSDI